MLITIMIIISVSSIGLLAWGAYQLRELEHYIAEIEKELYKLKNTEEEISVELSRINNEPIKEGFFDKLTGLPIRQVFEDRLNQALIQGKRHQTTFAVITLDIDKFCEINKLGYAVGDKLLKEFANRLQMSIRQIDTVTRFAGDNFLLLLPQLSKPETAAYVAQRIQDSLLQSFKIEEYEFFVTACIGIVIYPVDGEDMSTLLKNAEIALHQAKTQGKNVYQFFQKDIHALGQREISLASCIRSPDVCNKLLVQYHPFFNTATKEVVYIQASPHLHHPEFGLVPFEKFARIAENSGKILEIGAWLLRTSIIQFHKWQEQGFKPEKLAIDVTLRQIENPHFIYQISEVLKEFDANPIHLVIEISDDHFPVNTFFVEKIFSLISEMKIQVSVGVIALGNFSLQKISKIPINYLKIDSKLIHAAVENEENKDVLRRIISLAKEENILVMAEGIDEDSQKNMMIELGCEIMEGKMFNHLLPVNAEENLSA